MPLKEFLITDEPYYKAVGSEIAHYRAAYADRMPIVLKGPTGCGKTRFVEHMAWLLKTPMLTVSCHEDMTASDLVGRFLLDADGTIWHDGPLTLAVRHGAICYLDEIVEARQDTSVVIHSLTDYRRMLSLEKKNEVVKAHPDFHLVISYNPGYQSVLKDLKESTKQRFGAINFSYPEPAVEAEIIARESGVDLEVGAKLVKIAERSRNLKGHGLEEGCSTRMLIHVGKLINRGIPLGEACEIALVLPLTDDLDIRRALGAAIAACA
ncbi:MAG: CbbQ/NirQ/NorQ/GpvN family protein [Gammaproteobacteria bacterium]|nr:CbbQ/NirQ/NorQ/GpvN family protein [Gammaproteobacteria bacterium]MDH3465420.1 CbbQ/NirQ/NorQ/GpvN family protein [Gammaproteobacteria bacterium]